MANGICHLKALEIGLGLGGYERMLTASGNQSLSQVSMKMISSERLGQALTSVSGFIFDKVKQLTDCTPARFAKAKHGLA